MKPKLVLTGRFFPWIPPKSYRCQGLRFFTLGTNEIYEPVFIFGDRVYEYRIQYPPKDCA